MRVKLPDRRKIFIGLGVVLSCAGGAKVWAYVFGSANIAKETAYAVIAPPSSSAAIAKETGTRLSHRPPALPL